MLEEQAWVTLSRQLTWTEQLEQYKDRSRLEGGSISEPLCRVDSANDRSLRTALIGTELSESGNGICSQRNCSKKVQEPLELVRVFAIHRYRVTEEQLYRQAYTAPRGHRSRRA